MQFKILEFIYFELLEVSIFLYKICQSFWFQFNSDKYIQTDCIIIQVFSCYNFIQIKLDFKQAMICRNPEKNSQNDRRSLQINIDQSQVQEQSQNRLQSQQNPPSQQDSNTSQFYQNSNGNPSEQIESSYVNSQESVQAYKNNQDFKINNKYSSFTNNDYLILQDQLFESCKGQQIKNYNQKGSIIHPNKLNDDNQKYKKKSSNHLKQTMNQSIIEKDPEVEKIIHEVLIKRKQKQKQKAIVQNIIHPNTNAKKYSVSFVQKQKLAISRQKFKNNFNDSYEKSIKQDQQISSKCLQLEAKIKMLTRKKEKYERQKNKQDKQKMQKKALTQMSKRQISLQRLKKRLEKALNLNFNLTKRLKFQKNKFTSTLLQSHQKNVVSQKISIKHDSTLKNIEKNTQMNNSKTQKISDTFRSNLTDNYSSPDINQSQFMSFCQEKINTSKRGNIFKQQNKVLHIKKSTGKEKKCKICMETMIKTIKRSPLGSIQQKQLSEYEQKSPILQCNSYLIERSEKVSPNLEKDNIYIQNDMNFQEDNEKKVDCDKIKKQMDQMMQKFTLLEQKQKQLISRIEANARKIKQYENQHYIQVIQSL